ncbi:MAG TPA: TIGR02266 family protein [Polyangia bacterium]|nr:TIGR02266 family protein [Polyangia bacterium]
MSSEPTSPAPVRVRLRYAAFETFIEKFAPNVTRGGVFLASRDPRPVGEVFPFEVLLAGGEVALAGEGKVTWVRAFDPAAPHKPHGMGVQFLRLDAPSRAVVNQMLARKAAGAGSAPVRPASPTGGLTPLSRGRNGLPSRTGPLPTVDPHVDIAAELGVDETRLRRAIERNWLPPGRAAGELEELEALLRPDPQETVSPSQAAAELPRLLDPSARRHSGAFRPLAEMLTPERSEDPDAPR